MLVSSKEHFADRCSKLELMEGEESLCIHALYLLQWPLALCGIPLFFFIYLPKMIKGLVWIFISGPDSFSNCKFTITSGYKKSIRLFVYFLNFFLKSVTNWLFIFSLPRILNLALIRSSFS